jgi:flagellar basal body-associated protein FliL
VSNIDKSTLRKYFQEIKKETNCTKKERKRLLSVIKEEINNYLSENQNCTIEDIYKRFGTPNEFSNSLFQNMELDTYKHKLKVAKFIKICIIMISSIFIFMLTILFIDRQQNKPTEVIYELEQQE